MQSEKRHLRSVLRERLEAVTEAHARAAGEAIAERLCRGSHWATASIVASFSTIAGEVDTRPVAAAAQQAGKVLCFPRMISGRSFEFARVEDPDSMLRGRYGVREPDPACELVPIDGRMLILLPGLAFDRSGGRLGRGAGYYDRALAGARQSETGGPALIGVGFELQIVDRVPMTSTDVRLDACITEAGLVEAA